MRSASDRRIPLSYVQDRVAQLDAGGVAVESVYFPQADHFLVFTQAGEVLSVISAWMVNHDK